MMARWCKGLREVALGSASSKDGYGQTLADDLRALISFRRLRKVQLTWQDPASYAGDIHARFPLIRRFGDTVEAYRPEGDEHWFIISRDWFGWPDPPEFALLCFTADGRIAMGHDFHHWPQSWTRPAG
ncbi:hypothetical protein D2V17_02485 [Aurantiacibacter xanthus]|uniref:Uncharacterized protein n=1 Tax=Aurantiacibacter xanthus TaxID=1784712 RepID=A0A3A1PDN0_9SPHN|nr:hypothetical protein [Aurantiacibacter xanthus]RIV91919.1 hypothetical protein D2V17_02485 [Aurantiacibacter xanthus]